MSGFITMGPESVRAMLAGRKIETRRVLKPQPYDFPHPGDGRRCWNASGQVGGRICFSDEDLLALHGWRAGELRWVKEAWARDDMIDNGVRYYATDHVHELRRKRSARFMPRWASRLTIEVLARRVERLQAIDEAGALREGMTFEAFKCGDAEGGDARESFAIHWDRLNRRRGFGWATNPLVAVIGFRLHRANIGALLAERQAA
ncbi:MAG TPA: hypothetical protein VHG92_02795 [Afifellaceae bacterium]|nr:hypothetical protein [Afifellaceae bacterium]